jgi:hypothetical protein
MSRSYAAYTLACGGISGTKVLLQFRHSFANLYPRLERPLHSSAPFARLAGKIERGADVRIDFRSCACALDAVHDRGGAQARGWLTDRLVMGSMIGGGTYSLQQNIAVRTLGLDVGVHAYREAGIGGKPLGFASEWGRRASAGIGHLGYFVFPYLAPRVPSFFGKGNAPIAIVYPSAQIRIVALFLRDAERSSGSAVRCCIHSAVNAFCACSV